MKPFHYETCCVNSTAELIDAMTRSAREITYRTLNQWCDLAEFKESHGYTRGTGLSLKNDWAVSYHKGTYDGRPCYYLRHSCIEYIFTREA